MDMEQVIKQLDWLDSERRRDKDAIASLQEQLQAQQRDVPKIMQRLNEAESELTQMKTQFERFDQIELQINSLRVDFTRQSQEVAERLARDLETVDKRNAAELVKINIAIGDLKKTLAVLPEFEAEFSQREEEEHRLGRLIAELEKRVEVIGREDEPRLRTIKMLEENRRQDSKRILDLQAETDQFRKRLDEQRGKLELLSDNVRKYEGRLGDLKNGEKQRQQDLSNFLEKQTLRAVDQEHEWKQIREKFDMFVTKFAVYEQRIAELSVLSQTLEKSQNTYDDVNERLERRIHEITEMQRLATEHMRQDWENFQGSDQKRWTSFMLKEEERQKENDRLVEKIFSRADAVEAETLLLRDMVKSIKEARLRQIQNLAELLNTDLEDAA